MKNSQILESKREEELLRQQEAFINQNRLHIEKRRRSREHSPERDRGDREYRDRDRSRSFSPPRRRDRKPYPTFRDNRAGRRANSRDRDNPMKRNRGGDGDSNPEKNDPKVRSNKFIGIILMTDKCFFCFIIPFVRLMKTKKRELIDWKLRSKKRNEKKFCETKKCGDEKRPKS